MAIERLDELFDRYADRALTAAEEAELAALLADPEGRRRWLELTSLEGKLQEELLATASGAGLETKGSMRRSLGRRPARPDRRSWMPALFAACLLAGVTVLVALGTRGPGGKERESAAARGAREAEARRRAARIEAECRPIQEEVTRIGREKQRVEETRRQASAPNQEEDRRRAEAELARIAAAYKEAVEKLERARAGELKAPADLPRPPEEKPAQDPRPETKAAMARLEQALGEVLLVTGTQKRPARAGEEIAAGQGLESVGLESRAAVKFPDGTRLEVGGETAIRELSHDRGKQLSLTYGTIAADVAKQPAGQPMVFTTPHGEAKVVGTTLRIVVDPDKTRLEVVEGKVQFKRKLDGKIVDVPSGHYAVASAGVELAAVQAVLFADDFDDGKATRWAFSPKYPWTVTPTAGRGFALTSPRSALDLEPERRDVMAFAPAKPWQDLSVQVEVRLEEIAPQGLASFLVFVRYRDPENYVWFEYMRDDKGGCEGVLFHRIGGKFSVLGRGPAAPLEAGRVYRVRVEAQGEEVRAWVDGKEVAQGKTLVAGPGLVALCPMRSRLSFDDVRVTALPRKEKR